MFEALSVGPAIIWTRAVFLLLGIWFTTEFFLRLAASANLSLQHFREHSVKFFFAFILFGRLFAV
ncbi:MAG: hypothetical protein QF815_02160, partial [Candidatus Peribacteraceae bacterium]|nr:hypothetical protein [Candidatus Peribacteraceae bacterium]